MTEKNSDKNKNIPKNVGKKDNVPKDKPVEDDSSILKNDSEINKIQDLETILKSEFINKSDNKIGKLANKSSKEIKELNAKLAELQDRFTRQVADNENMRKRFAREQQDMGKYAINGFARELISVVENLHMAATNIPQKEKENNELFKNIAIGIEMTLNEFMGILEKNGIKRFMPEIGDKFDHNLHQAMSQIETDEVEEGAICEIAQAGYNIHDRLLRAAMVAVANKPNNKKPAVDSATGEELESENKESKSDKESESGKEPKKESKPENKK